MVEQRKSGEPIAAAKIKGGTRGNEPSPFRAGKLAHGRREGVWRIDMTGHGVLAIHDHGGRVPLWSHGLKSGACERLAALAAMASFGITAPSAEDALAGLRLKGDNRASALAADLNAFDRLAADYGVP